MLIKVGAGIVFVGACCLFYFGGGWLFVVPQFPGDSYFTPERMLYGTGPVLVGAGLLVIVGWLWARANPGVSRIKAIARSFQWAIAAVWLFWLGLMVIGGIRQG